MKRINRFVTLTLAIVLLVFAFTLFGSMATTAAAVTNHIIEIIPDELEPSTRVGNKQVSDLTGAPLALYRVNYPVAAGTAEAMASQYLRENTAVLHLQSADLNDLEHRFTHTGPAGTTVRFTQVVHGIPVYKAVIVVHINNDNLVTYVANDYKSNINLDNLTPTVTSNGAHSAAKNYLDVQGNVRYDKTELIIYQIQDQSYLAYLVRLVADSPLGDWEVIVDAHTGDFLKVFDTSYSYAHQGNHEPGTVTAAGQSPPLLNRVPVTGTGTVFDPDPLSSAQATYGDTGFVDGSDADTTQLNGELTAVDLLEIDFSGGLYTLIGPYAEIVDSEAPTNGLFAQATDTFNFNRFDDAFEAVNTYYHIDSSMRYINETLGIPLAPFQYSGGARFDPHGLSGADNSHYLSATGEVAFGEGGVDDAEDSDVIHHELGHALHDWVTNGNLSQVNGLSEGLGDYWAQSYNRSLGNWLPADPPFQWVFNWDGHNPFWPGRITNYNAVYPGGLIGQIHTDGQIWSTCNMKVYDAIGKTKIDTAMWEGLAMTNSSTNQEMAANAVYQAAIDMGYPTADLQAIYDTYATCVYVVPPVPGGSTYCSTPSLSIPDNTPAGVTDDIVIASGGNLTDLDISLDVTHTWVGDLVFTVEHVDTGTTATFFDRPGYTGTGAGCSGDNVDVIANDEGVNGNIESQCSNLPAISGDRVGGDPANTSLLAAFDGESLAGTWRITASDHANIDVGTLNEWCLLPPSAEPIITVEPTSLSSNLSANTQVTQTLTISNTGTAALTWDIFEDISGKAASTTAVPSQAASQPRRLGPTTPVAQPLKGLQNYSGPIVADGGFEAGTPSPFWNEFSTNFGTPLCDASCGMGGGTGPHSGAWWAWSGGVNATEIVTVDQDVIIPAGSAELSFWLEIPVADNTGFLNVDIDGTVVFSVTQADQATYATYQQVVVDVTAFADGGTHNLRFNFTTDPGSNLTNFFVDDVDISSLGPVACDLPEDIAWLSASPISDTTSAGSSSLVDVTFDSTGYSAGVYTGTLCINSNDPVTPLVTVPMTMTVLPNAAPVAAADAYTTTQDVALPVVAPGVLGNDTDGDGDSLTAVLDTNPSNGTLSLNADGSFTYTPTVGFDGSDSFTYHANDGIDVSNVATVAISVLNTPPVAVADDYTVDQDTVLSPPAPGVLGNDSDADGDVLTAVLDTPPSHGTLTLNANGSFTYTPQASHVGTDSFTYHANDGTDDSNVVTVTIKVAAASGFEIYLPFVTKG